MTQEDWSFRLYKKECERADKYMEDMVWYKVRYENKEKQARKTMATVLQDMRATAPQDRAVMDPVYIKWLYTIASGTDGIEYDEVDREIEATKIDRAKRTV